MNQFEVIMNYTYQSIRPVTYTLYTTAGKDIFMAHIPQLIGNCTNLCSLVRKPTFLCYHTLYTSWNGMWLFREQSIYVNCSLLMISNDSRISEQPGLMNCVGHMLVLY